jgi:phosphoglycolate phosphatase
MPAARAPHARRPQALPIDAVLFDLDGTLVDTAPDLAAALNRVRAGRGLAPMPLERLRPFASHGTRGLIGAGMGVTPEEPAYEALRDAFLAQYASALCVDHALPPVHCSTRSKHGRSRGASSPTRPRAIRCRCSDRLTPRAALSSAATRRYCEAASGAVARSAARLGVAPERCVASAGRRRQRGRRRGCARSSRAMATSSSARRRAWPADGFIDEPAGSSAVPPLAGA